MLRRSWSNTPAGRWRWRWSRRIGVQKEICWECLRSCLSKVSRRLILTRRWTAWMTSVSGIRRRRRVRRKESFRGDERTSGVGRKCVNESKMTTSLPLPLLLHVTTESSVKEEQERSKKSVMEFGGGVAIENAWSERTKSEDDEPTKEKPQDDREEICSAAQLK